MDKVSRLHFPSPFLYPLPIPIPGLAPPIPTPPAITKRRVLIPSRLVSPRSYSRLFLATSNPFLLLLAFFLLPLRRASLSIYLCLSVFLFLGGNRDRFYDRSVVSIHGPFRAEIRARGGGIERNSAEKLEYGYNCSAEYASFDRVVPVEFKLSRDFFLLLFFGSRKFGTINDFYLLLK